MAEIVFDGVTKRYDDGFEAVKSLNLDIKDGEFMILVGPSGCGKSTALRMVAGLEDISGGELKIGGAVVNMTGHPEAVLARELALCYTARSPWSPISTRGSRSSTGSPIRRCSRCSARTSSGSGAYSWRR